MGIPRLDAQRTVNAEPISITKPLKIKDRMQLGAIRVKITVGVRNRESWHTTRAIWV